jgi:hypothetical protein
MIRTLLFSLLLASCGQDQSINVLEPKLAYSPGAVDFGEVAVDYTETFSVEIINAGRASLDVNAIHFSGGNPGIFSVEPTDFRLTMDAHLAHAGSEVIIIRKELLLPLLAGIFLMESLSVIIQVSYFKHTKKKYGEGRRIFLMSPLHHHYQKKGYPEAKIVMRFFIIGVMLAVLTIVTLKLR